jgi:hypothetical protein
LPDLNHGIRDRHTIAIDNAARQPNPFAFGLWVGDALYGAGIGHAEVKIRASGL